MPIADLLMRIGRWEALSKNWACPECLAKQYYNDDPKELAGFIRRARERDSYRIMLDLFPSDPALRTVIHH